MRAEAQFAAMGSTAHVVVLGRDAALLVERAQARLADLERRWSRFRDDSEVSWLNRSAGCDVVVSWETMLLVGRSLEGWRVTDGRFDPTVLHALLRAGYVTDFATLDRRPARARRDEPAAVDAAGIVVDSRASTVRLPAGVGFDGGGIGKGLAADLVAEELGAAGPDGVCVNVGGDLRVLGDAPHWDGWRIDLDDPESHLRFGQVVLRDGGVATSSPLRRQWTSETGDVAHHLIDPRTGASASTPTRTVTVVAAEAWQAEVLTKAAMFGDLDCVERAGAAALVRGRGREVATASWWRFVPHGAPR